MWKHDKYEETGVKERNKDSKDNMGSKPGPAQPRRTSERSSKSSAEPSPATGSYFATFLLGFGAIIYIFSF